MTVKPIKVRSGRRLLAAAGAAGLLALLLAAPAQAAAYRYWGYFQLTGSEWTFAQKGPDQSVPKDGSVEGWRFAVADEGSSRTPRAVVTFDQLCAGTTPSDGQKRIGLVIDFGRPADDAAAAEPPAPRATCVSVPEQANGSDVLAQAGLKLRIEKGLTCALDGWPTTGCGEPVAKVPAAAASPDTSITIAPAATLAARPAGRPASEDPDDGLAPAAWVGIAIAVLVGAGLAFAAVRRGGELRE